MKRRGKLALKRKRKKIKIACLAGIGLGILLVTIPLAGRLITDIRNSQAVVEVSATYDRFKDNPLVGYLLQEAEKYNAWLLDGRETSGLSYSEQLLLDGETAMGYISIPKINVQMPIYHGTSDEVLAVGAGHLESSSLPIGGSGSHAVLTAHSGMRFIRAFDDIRKLKAGDTFTLTVLGKILTYEVMSTETVLPDETGSLAIDPEKDLVTLVTCTPIGINDHRLLVHAERLN